MKAKNIISIIIGSAILLLSEYIILGLLVEKGVIH